MPPQSLPEVQSCATEVTWRSARFEGRRAKPSPHSRASAQRLRSAVCGGAAACCTWQSTRVARSPRGRRIRHLAGGDAEPEQRRLRSRTWLTATPDIHMVLPSSLDCQEEYYRAQTRLAYGGAGQRWFFLGQSWLGSSPLTQHNHPSSPPPSPRFVAAISVAHGAMHYRH